MSNNYADNLLQSMSIIAEQAVKNAGYDRTVQATIVSCVDPTIGKYKVNYQNGSWYAFSSNTNTTYVKGASVYVLIPGGDMNNTKTILGTTKQLGINYISTIEDIEKYALNGDSITTGGNFDLCSYKSETVVLYDTDIKNSVSRLSININSANTYLKKSSHLVVSTLVRTNLPVEQRYNGNYGLNFYLVFAVATEGDTAQEVIRKYTFDVDNMEGNPYVLPNGLNQQASFEIDGANFKRISKIEMFVTDFPNPDSNAPNDEHPNDIFLSNISLFGANILTQEELDGVALVLNAPKGYIFNSTKNEDTRTINAEVRVQGKTIDNKSQKLAYYWFVQDCTITSNNLFYCKYGGQGWKCLNKYKVIKDSLSYSFNAGPASLTITGNDVLIKQKKYKCVVVYDNTVISKQFIMMNNSANYIIKIESDIGTEFIKDTGYPTLKCKVTDKNNVQITSGLEYIWAQTTNTGVVNFLQDQTIAYTSYQQKLTNYNNLKNGFKNGTKLKNGIYSGSVTNITQYNNLEKELKTLNITQYVIKDRIVHLNVKNITNFSIFTCTIKDESHGVVGTASITIVNKATSTGGYSVIINDGSQVFNYDENGVSPCSRSQSEPFNIPALSFTLYDMNGREINQDDIKSNDVEWIIPITNTMLEVSDGKVNTDQVTRTVKGKILAYSIAQRYSINRTNNDIQLRVKYHDYIISNKTNFTFTKQGQLGTNGTGFVVKIVPCNSSGQDIGIYPVATTTDGTTYTYNFHHLNIQLWHNGERIFNDKKTGNSTESKSVNIVWSILKNRYASNTYDNTSFTINADSGTLGNNSGMNLVTLCSELNKTTPTPTSSTALSNTPANIIKAAVVYDGITYYATLPIITVYKNNIAKNANYSVTLAQNTGFRYVVYSEDGRTPQYDNHEPFTLKVTMPVNGQKEDVSISTVSGYSPIYKYGYLGEYYEGTSRKSKICLMNNGIAPKDPPKNTKYVKPIDSYDGLTVTNAVYSIVTIGNAVMFIHIPIHFMLNRYGHSAINAWDGNSVSIDKDGSGMILSPQVGAGKKEKDESFTGILIGNVKQTNPVKEQTGLFGYRNGQRSIFLDAASGNAHFGVAGDARINISGAAEGAAPKGSIYSGNYYTYENGIPKAEASTGMLIDLTTPRIRFGSGNFVVSSNGHLTAKGGGSIAGWSFDDDSLWKNFVTSSTSKNEAKNVRLSSVDFPRSINRESVTTLRFALGTQFGVTNNGELYAGKAYLGTGNNKIILESSQDPNNKDDKGNYKSSAIYCGKDSMASTHNGFYLGTDGIALGPYNSTNENSAFQVTTDGILTARKGYIGNGNKGFTITNQAIYNGKSLFNSIKDINPGVYVGTTGISLGAFNTNENSSPFWVNNEGKIHATSGTIGGFTLSNSAIRSSITQDSFINSKAKDPTDPAQAVIHEPGVYLGTAGLRIGENFHVTGRSGHLWCNSITANGTGHIGGWAISPTSLKAEGKDAKGNTIGYITIDSGGALQGGSNLNSPNWKIEANGDASFNHVKITGTNSTWNDGTIESGSRTGGSITGGTIGSGGNSSYVSVGTGTKIKTSDVQTDFTDSDGKTSTITLDKWCNNITCKTLEATYKLTTGKKGYAIFNGSAYFGDKVVIASSLYAHEGDRETPGLTGKAHFSEGGWLQFADGILIHYSAVKDGGLNEWS